MSSGTFIYMSINFLSFIPSLRKQNMFNFPKWLLICVSLHLLIKRERVGAGAYLFSLKIVLQMSSYSSASPGSYNVSNPHL